MCTFHRWCSLRTKYRIYCHTSVLSIFLDLCSRVCLFVWRRSHCLWFWKCSYLPIWRLLSQRRYWRIWGLDVWCCFRVGLWVLWVAGMRFSIWKVHQNPDWWYQRASQFYSRGLRHRHTPSRCRVSVFRAGRRRICRKWHRAWKWRRGA